MEICFVAKDSDLQREQVSEQYMKEMFIKH